MNTKHESDLLARKVKSLIIEDDGKDTLVCNNGHSWSVAKLLLLGQWADLYSTVIHRNFPRCRFVDLLAGAGKTRLKKTKEKLVKGSVFVVETFSQKHPFNKYILVEKNTKKCEALRRRTQAFGDRCEVIKNDANKVVDEIFSHYSDHNLVFIDNEGFNVEWESIEAVMKAKADILINYPTSMFERVAQDAKSANKLDRFFGDDSWREATYDRKYSTTIYMNKLRASYEKIKRETTTWEIPAYVSNIRLGTDTYFYDIILVCKYGPYTHFWDELRSDWYHKNSKCLIDFITDKSKSLDCFNGFSEKVEALDKKSKVQKVNPNENLERFSGNPKKNNSKLHNKNQQ